MRLPSLLASIAFLAFVSPANAAEIYVSPSGTATTGCTRSTPCSLASAAGSAVAGDTVVLMDGVYDTSLYVANSDPKRAVWMAYSVNADGTLRVKNLTYGVESKRPWRGIERQIAKGSVVVL